jgi:hypothetical protein
MASTSTRTRLCAALAALAVAAPVAAARPVHSGDIARKPTSPAASPVQKVVVVRDTGFDWADAAIGGAVAAGLFGVAGAGVLIARHPREDTGPALGAN